MFDRLRGHKRDDTYRDKKRDSIITAWTFHHPPRPAHRQRTLLLKYRTCCTSRSPPETHCPPFLLPLPLPLPPPPLGIDQIRSRRRSGSRSHLCSIRTYVWASGPHLMAAGDLLLGSVALLRFLVVLLCFDDSGWGWILHWCPGWFQAGKVSSSLVWTGRHLGEDQKVRKPRKHGGWREKWTRNKNKETKTNMKINESNFKNNEQ